MITRKGRAFLALSFLFLISVLTARFALAGGTSSIFSPWVPTSGSTTQIEPLGYAGAAGFQDLAVRNLTLSTKLVTPTLHAGSGSALNLGGNDTNEWQITSSGALTGLVSGAQLTWTTGLGAITHIPGPSDQPLQIEAGTGQALVLGGNATAAVKIDTNNNVIANNTGSALATGATNGFFYLPTCAGPATGTPGTLPTGAVPFVYDTTDDRLYVRNGSQKYVVFGASGATTPNLGAVVNAGSDVNGTSASAAITYATGGTYNATSAEIKGPTDQGMFVSASPPAGSGNGNTLQLTSGNATTTGSPGTINLTGGSGAGTNQAGNDAFVDAPRGTGNTANQGSVRLRTAYPGASGASVGSVGDRLVVCGNTKTLSTTSNTAQTVALLSVATSSSFGGTAFVTVEANDGANWDVAYSTINFVAINKAGTVNVQSSNLSAACQIGNSGSVTTGLTALASGTNLAIQVQPVFTTIVPTQVRCTYTLNINGGPTTVTPQ